MEAAKSIFKAAFGESSACMLGTLRRLTGPGSRQTGPGLPPHARWLANTQTAALQGCRRMTQPNAVPCCAMLCHAASCCVPDPLVMENGQDLVTMCCHAYEAPDDADEEEEGELVDYCECQALSCPGSLRTLANSARSIPQMAAGCHVATCMSCA